MARILILHALDASQPMRRTIWQRSLAGPRHAPHHEWLFHHVFTHPRHLPRNLDLVILDTSFLWHRWGSSGEAIFRRFRGPLRALSCPKIALPQDDYDHHLTLDRWLTAFGVDVVFTPLPSFYPLLYPETTRRARVLHAFTGYVDPEDTATPVSPWDSRPYDVVYRAAKLPEWFGTTGLRKSNLGVEFAPAASREGLNTNLDGPPFFGHDWARFLSSSRFTIGSPSGASVADPDGSIRQRVLRYKESHPGAGFFEVQRACFPLSDRAPMTTIGPRLWEAALLGVGLILTPGNYEPFLPWVHYWEAHDLNTSAHWVAAYRREPPDTVQAARDLALDPRYSYRQFVYDLLHSVYLEPGPWNPVSNLPETDCRIMSALGVAPTKEPQLLRQRPGDFVNRVRRRLQRFSL